jgi:2-isopropylmalate synthase
MDETLRDGLQGASARQPSLPEKQELLARVAGLGVQCADLGLPGAGPRMLQEVVALARFVADERLPLEPNCAARTHPDDVAAVAEAVQRSGQPLVCYAFIGCSPIRQYVEGWDAEGVARRAEESLALARRLGLEVGLVLEDATRATPALVGRLVRAAADAGATRLVLCDTVGHATPAGTRALVGHVAALLAAGGHADAVALEWHGHNDRGLALVNALTAAEAGARRLHGCGLGVGERAGNTALDQLLVNLHLEGRWPHPLEGLVAYVEAVARACGLPVPANYPVAGRDAFRTATGVHAAAIRKARARGDAALADRVYSAVPAADFGLAQQVEVGPLSGASNVAHWLEAQGLTATAALCQALLAHARACGRVLGDDELRAHLDALGEAARPGARRGG